MHHLLDGNELETAVVILFGEEVVLETPARVLLIEMPASGFFDPKTFSQSEQVQSAVEAHFAELAQSGEAWLDYGECLLAMAHAH